MEVAVIVVLLIVSLGLFALYAYFSHKFSKEDAERAAKIEREFKEKHPHYEAEEFYKGCCEAGITTAKTNANKARIQLYARNHSGPSTQKAAVDLFLLGKSEVERIAAEERKAEEIELIKELKTEEKEYEQKLHSYSHLFGQEKMRTMCLDYAKPYKEQLDILEKKYYNTLHSAQRDYAVLKQKEQDWAVLGGIADGIAGPGAGAAVAMDIQLQNAEIRAQNAQLQQSINSIAALKNYQNFEKQCEVKKELKFWNDMAENASKLLVQDLPNVDLMERIAPVIVEQKQSKTDAIKIKVKITPAENLKIYDTVDAVVDGSIKALLWDGDENVGEAHLPLPFNGVTDITTIEGICCSHKLKPNKKYKVTIEVNRLWGVERIKST